ncbi:7444_t:CDS:2, partial [Racocetra persica]
RLTVDCLGITRDSAGCYLIVMKYYRENLYSHLKNGTKYLHWKDIVNMLHKIANGLKQIHDHKLYHGNLHGGNLLIEHTIEGIHVRISDIGLHRNSSALNTLVSYLVFFPFVQILDVATMNGIEDYEHLLCKSRNRVNSLKDVNFVNNVNFVIGEILQVQRIRRYCE